MTVPIKTSLKTVDGTDRHVIIEPLQEKNFEKRTRNTGSYKISKDSFGDGSCRLTEPADVEYVNEDLDGNLSPGYLGELRLIGDKWSYSGNLLSYDEQAQIAATISSRSGI